MTHAILYWVSPEPLTVYMSYFVKRQRRERVSARQIEPWISRVNTRHAK